ncbi:MAG: MFS transporter [Chloroflexi bacterium]|nr:MFS transporter [Chloroflexota bacterium]
MIGSRSLSRFVPRMDRDGKIIIIASAIRTLDYGFLSVFLGVYLSLLDFTALQAGMVFSGIMAGSALSNLVAGWQGDAIGRRRLLVSLSVMMVVGGLLFPWASSVWVLMLIGLFAVTTSSGGDRTAFISMDTAILAQTCEPSQRTLTFSWYNLVSIFTKATGALLVSVPVILQAWAGMEEVASFKVMFAVYAVLALSGVALYGRLSPNVEPPVQSAGSNRLGGSSADRKLIMKMTALSSLDAFGGGFVARGFISYWFVSRFGMDVVSVSGVFFAAQMLNVVSVAFASPVASRIGLVNTMAFSQAIANVLFIAMAFASNLWMAVLFFFLHELSNDMDVPTRQSYTMAIVPQESRTAMATLNNLGRNAAQVVSPTIGGLVAQVAFIGAPFLAGAAVKLVYNYMLYQMFKGIKAPEESEEIATDTAGEPAGD